MLDKANVKIDDLGRIVIPNQIRKKFSLEKNEFLTLESDDEKIILRRKTVSEKYKKTIEKLNYIKKEYNLSMIMINNNEIVYTTKEYNYLLNKKIYKDFIFPDEINYSKKTQISKTDILEQSHYYFSIYIDSYTKAVLFIFDKDINKETVNLLYNLLK